MYIHTITFFLHFINICNCICQLFLSKVKKERNTSLRLTHELTSGRKTAGSKCKGPGAQWNLVFPPAEG